MCVYEYVRLLKHVLAGVYDGMVAFCEYSIGQIKAGEELLLLE